MQGRRSNSSYFGSVNIYIYIWSGFFRLKKALKRFTRELVFTPPSRASSEGGCKFSTIFGFHKHQQPYPHRRAFTLIREALSSLGLQQKHARMQKYAILPDTGHPSGPSDDMYPPPCGVGGLHMQHSPGRVRCIFGVQNRVYLYFRCFFSSL